jgi:hypothetical protein
MPASHSAAERFKKGGSAMQRSRCRLVSLGVCTFIASAVFAGTPLPNPPFSSGGFVPPDSTVLKQEVSVGKVLTKYAGSIAKCDQKAVIGLQLAYEPANPTKIEDLQNQWTACRAAAGDKYAALRDKVLLKGTPACLDQAGIDAIRAQIDAQFPLLGPIVYCDGDAAAPDPVTGLNIPDFKIEASGEVSAAKVVTRAGTLAGKCYTKAVTSAFKLGGTLPPDILAKIDACLMKAKTASDTAMDKLDQTQKLPSCLSLATAQGLDTSAVNLAGQFTDDTYCASPSGAFVE